MLQSIESGVPISIFRFGRKLPLSLSQVNLWLSMLSVSLMLAALLPSCFGMNIKHGFEDTLWFFYTVTLGSIVMGALSFPAMFNHYKRAWKMQSEHELGKINQFRIVLMQVMVERGG